MTKFPYLFASLLLSSLVYSKAPIAPSPFDGMKPMIASNTVRTKKHQNTSQERKGVFALTQLTNLEKTLTFK